MVFGDVDEAVAAAGGTQAARDAALKPAVTAPGYDPDTGVWTTNQSGRVDISGLRYSDFADGVVVGPDDPRYQSYWLVETKALANHQLLVSPIEFVVTEGSLVQNTETIVNRYNRGGFLLPLTGGLGTILFTVGGLALVATVLIVARRRRQQPDAVAEQQAI